MNGARLKVRRQLNDYYDSSDGIMHLFISDYSVELQKTLRSDVQSLDFIYEYGNLERLMIDSFNSSKKFREGNLKTSFIYLLIDPRISENLLAELSVCMRSDWSCAQLLNYVYSFYNSS